MTTQASAFVASYLEPTVAPSPAVAFALREYLLTKPLANPIDTGAQGSPRNVPGIWSDAYAVHHGIVTADELAPCWNEWTTRERDDRGLPDGPLAEPLTHVYKSSHFTLTQHALIGALHPDAAQRKLSTAQMLKLADLGAADGVVTKPDWVGASRALGWTGDGLLLAYRATSDLAMLGAAWQLAGKLNAAKGSDADGHVWLWRNPHATHDARHVYDQCPWMDATCLLFLARLYRVAPLDALRDLILHALRVFAQAQQPDGIFVDDIGFDVAGVWGSKSDGKPTLDPWIHAAIVTARLALGIEWPSWADGMLELCHAQWLALNRYKPTDSGFKDMHVQAAAIAVAPAWGWRA